MPLITLRIELPVLSLSIYMIFVSLLLAYNIKTLFHRFRVPRIHMVVYAFVTVTLLSALYSSNVIYGLTQWFKLLVAILLYGCLTTIFFHKPIYIKTIMKASCVSLSVYLMYLMWHYLVRFNLTFIGIVTDYGTGSGKNSLAFMVSFVLPFTLCFLTSDLMKGNFRLTQIVTVLVTLIGAVLIQSRALFLLIVFYIAFILRSQPINWRTVRITACILVLLLLMVLVVVPSEVVDSVIWRVASFKFFTSDNYVSSDISGLGSLESRTDLLRQGIQMFAERPFLGHGLGSYRHYGVTSKVSHNDYILILAEQGVLGFMVFLVMVGYFIWRAYANYKYEGKDLDVSLAMVGMFLYLLFINAHDNILLWTAMAMVSSKTVSRGKELEHRRPLALIVD